MKKVLVIGETLVEVMADTKGYGFLEPMTFTGPFPSGAPTIFISQAARMGGDTAYISAVGDDDFGRVNLERLTAGRRRHFGRRDRSGSSDGLRLRAISGRRLA